MPHARQTESTSLVCTRLIGTLYTHYRITLKSQNDMKRVNSESNAKRWSSESHVSLLGHGRVATEFAESKQGLSIAESCASSTTVKQTLDITINGQAMHLTGEETEPGRAQLTVTTDKGEYTDDGNIGGTGNQCLMAPTARQTFRARRPPLRISYL